LLGFPKKLKNNLPFGLASFFQTLHICSIKFGGEVLKYPTTNFYLEKIINQTRNTPIKDRLYQHKQAI
jgi:hypothetical protein